MAGSTNVLLVEGNSEAELIEVLASRLRCAPWTHFEPEPMVTRERVGSKEPAQLLRAKLNLGRAQRVGVVVDADEDAAAKWAKLLPVLLEFGCEALPAHPPTGGWVGDLRLLGSEPCRVGIWILPDNASPGILEDFALDMVPATDPLKPLAIEAVATARSRVPEKDATGARLRFKDRHEAKARLRTWYAWQHSAQASPRFRQIAEALPEPRPAILGFEAWLHNLFVSPLPPL